MGGNKNRVRHVDNWPVLRVVGEFSSFVRLAAELYVHRENTGLHPDSLERPNVRRLPSIRVIETNDGPSLVTRGPSEK